MYKDTILSKNKLSRKVAKRNLPYHISVEHLFCVVDFFFTLIKNTELFDSAIWLQEWYLKKIRRIKTELILY